MAYACAGNATYRQPCHSTAQHSKGTAVAVAGGRSYPQWHASITTRRCHKQQQHSAPHVQLLLPVNFNKRCIQPKSENQVRKYTQRSTRHDVLCSYHVCHLHADLLCEVVQGHQNALLLHDACCLAAAHCLVLTQPCDAHVTFHASSSCCILSCKHDPAGQQQQQQHSLLIAPAG